MPNVAQQRFIDFDNAPQPAERHMVRDISTELGQLCIRQTNGRYRAATVQEITAAAADALMPTLQKRDVLTSPEATRKFLKLRIQHKEHEVFACLFLDNHHRVIEYKELFRGTIDGASVHPREVVKESLLHNAAAVIFAHNHPSGVAEPSQADVRITERLKDSLALVDVRVLDHIVIGDGATVSFAERGLL